MLEINRILFPVDFTENSSKIFSYALSVSEKYGAILYLLHIVEDPSKWDKFYIPMGEYPEEGYDGAEKTLERICEEQLQNYPCINKMILSGDPAQEIIKTIESEEIDLVIMGTHGRKGLDHVIFGSVAENVLRESPVPVLVINPYRIKNYGSPSLKNVSRMVGTGKV